VLSRLELAVGLAAPAKIGLPVASVVREVRVMGALAKFGLVVGRPPKRMDWSIRGGAGNWRCVDLLCNAEGVAVADSGERLEREEPRRRGLRACDPDVLVWRWCEVGL
jgi:hypothetical protein